MFSVNKHLLLVTLFLQESQNLLLLYRSLIVTGHTFAVIVRSTLYGLVTELDFNTNNQ